MTEAKAISVSHDILGDRCEKNFDVYLRLIPFCPYCHEGLPESIIGPAIKDDFLTKK